MPLITRPCGKEQGIDWPSQKAVAKGESIQAFNPNGNIIGRFQLADKFPVARSKALILQSPKLPTKRRLPNSPKPAGTRAIPQARSVFAVMPLDSHETAEQYAVGMNTLARPGPFLYVS
ncbi:hypothetical protein [Methylobacter sp. sgz302048]|uniref:hypothetical protein n=1 Tax=Methylobacter sp. sgz302048 TaxID=3455945 RepID=UPI003FA014C5